MPILELVNHAPMAGNWETHVNGDIGVNRKYDGEILVKYSNSDPIQRVMFYGFNCRESMCFSLKVNVLHRRFSVKIIGGGGRHWFLPPEVKVEKDTITIRQPLLGFRQGPKLAKTLFLKAFRDFDDIDACELFEQVHQANILALVDLLQLLENQTSETAQRLRHGCLDQLLALSDHVGYRPELLSQDEEVETTKSLSAPQTTFMR